MRARLKGFEIIFNPFLSKNRKVFSKTWKMISDQPLRTIVQQMKSQESDSSDLARLEDQEEMRDEMLEETKGMGSDFSAYGLYSIPH